MKTAIEKTKQEADDFALNAVMQNQTIANQNAVHQAFGALGGMRLVSRFINVTVIKILQEVRDTEKYKDFGFSNFKDFLETHELPQKFAGISYKTFNNLENQLKAEGDVLYELLNDFRVPISTRQVLALNGEVEISIEGEKLIIGDQEVSLEDRPKARELIKNLATENKKLVDDSKAKESKIERLNEQIKTGTDEFQELRRALDSQAEGSPLERAITKASGGLINLAIEAKNAPIVEKNKAGRGAIETLWKQILVVRHALLQEDFAFIDDMSAGTDGISVAAMRVISENDDFGDELEQ